MNRAVVGAGVVAVAVAGLTGLVYVGPQVAAAVARSSVTEEQWIVEEQRVAHPQMTRAEARAEIEIHGRTWAEFLAQTTDRPMYDIGFVSAWLNQRTPSPEES